MYHKSLHKKQEKGQGLVEYALILVLVAIVANFARRSRWRWSMARTRS
jgi:hypothetical protein